MNHKCSFRRVLAWCSMLLCGVVFLASTIFFGVAFSIPFEVAHSRRIELAAHAQVLPENEGRQVRVAGALCCEEVTELPAWGIRLPAVELQCTADGPAAKYAGVSTASHFRVGEFELDCTEPPFYHSSSKLYSIQDEAPPEQFFVPLPRCEIRTVPQDIHEIEWRSAPDALELVAECEGERVLVRFRYCPSGGDTPLLLSGLQQGNMLKHIKYYSQEDRYVWSDLRYDPPLEPSDVLAVLLVPLELLLVVLPACAGMLRWSRKLRAPAHRMNAGWSAVCTGIWSLFGVAGVYMLCKSLFSAETELPLWCGGVALLFAACVLALHVAFMRRAARSTTAPRAGDADGLCQFIFIADSIIMVLLFIGCIMSVCHEVHMRKSEPIAEASADRVLPELEGKLVRVCGVAHALDVKEVAENAPAAEPLKLVVEVGEDEDRVVASSPGRHIVLGAYTLTGDSISYMKGRVNPGMLYLVGRQQGDSLHVLHSFPHKYLWESATHEAFIHNGSEPLPLFLLYLFFFTVILVHILSLIPVLCSKPAASATPQKAGQAC